MRGRLGRTDLLVLSVVVIWAASFSVVKYALGEIKPLAFASVRFGTASVILLIWAWMTGDKPVIRREDWLRTILVGLTAVGIYQVFWTVGLQYTTASNSSLMLATIPAWTAVFAASSGQERIAPLQIVGLCMSFLGVALTIRGGGAVFHLTWDSVRGDAMTLVAAALSGASVVLSRRLLVRYSTLRMMSTSMLCGSLFLLVVSVPELVAQQWSHISWGTWLAVAFSAVPAAGIAYVIWFKSIGEIGASRTVIYNNLIPPVAILIALMTLGERLTALQALGAAIVLGGVILTRFAQVRGLEPEPLVQVVKSDGSG
jgi:drug/metabolite transporter (DMT)-like permease